MKHASSIHMVLVLGTLSLASPALTGCLRDVGLSGGSEVSGSGGGVGFSSSTSSGMVGGTSGVGGSVQGGVSSSSGMQGGVSSSSSGMQGGVGGSTQGSVSSSSSGMQGGVGGGGVSSSSSGVGGMQGGVSSSSSSSGAGGNEGGMTSSTSTSSSGSVAPACGLGAETVTCDFAHLNADCAGYGAVCDYLFNVCSCCFLHDELTCTTDADCEASFGASAFCSAGTCGCK